MIALAFALLLISTFTDASVLQRFGEWAAEHKITLPVDDDHAYMHMLENWVANDKLIAQTNAMNLSYTLGHNAFSAMNIKEFAEYMRLNPVVFADSANNVETSVNLRGSSFVSYPASVDWRTQNAVTPVKDQGQ